MAIVERSIDATVHDVFDVLLDGYLYEHWVVGSKEIRGVDESWPAVGSAFYHRFGAAGAEVRDKSEILELEIPHRIMLRTYARPVGIGRVLITVRPSDDGAIVSIEEEPEPGTRMRPFKPLLDPLVHLRNIEALRRFDRVVRIRATSRRASAQI